MNQAIVTGGAGFIGSHLVDALADRGERVLVIDDLRNHASKDDPSYTRSWPSSVRWRHQPVAAVAAWEHGKPDVIYHLADPVGPVGVLSVAGTIAYDVIRAAATVRDWALATKATLVYISTSEVYGSPDAANSEDTPRTFQPGHSARMEYAIAKAVAETMLLNTPDLDVRIVRPFNVTGPRQRVDGGFVLPRFIRQALAGDPLTVYTPGTQRRAFTHVADIVDGLLLVAERGYPGGVWNLGNAANEVSIVTLAHEVIEATGSTSRTMFVDPADLWGPGFREAPDKIPDASKAMRELGWIPTRDRATTIRDAIAGVRVPVAV